MNLTPIVLYNNTSSASPAPFQQMLIIPANTSINSTYTNIRFRDENYKLLTSWLESHTTSSATIWVVLPTGISSKSAMTIYMETGNLSDNFLDGVTVGEAPQLSGTYGQYDNGAKVFGFYENFAGTTLSSKWSVVGSGGSVNNGLSISMASGSTGDYVIYSTSTFSPPVIAETLFSTTAFATNLRTYNPTLSASNTQPNPAADGASSSVSDWSINGAASGSWNAQQGNNPAFFQSATGNNSAASNWLLGVGYTGSTNYWYGFNGATQTNYYTYTSSSTDSPTGALYFGLGANWGSISTTTTESYVWVRVRAYPPNGTIPIQVNKTSSIINIAEGLVI